MHTGHRECIARALEFLLHHGVKVDRAIVGFTTEAQVARKTVDSHFSLVQTRCAIAKEVLLAGDKMVLDVEVDNEAHSSGDALALKYAKAGFVDLYLVGSDLYKRPRPQTLVVTRTLQERVSCGPEYYDKGENKGVCWQHKSLGVTSTKVRDALADKRMPRLYSTKAQKLICSAMDWWGTKRAAVEASKTTTTEGATAINASAPRASGTPIVHVEEQPADSRVINLVEARPPLARKRPRQDTGDEVQEDRLPLPRRRPVARDPEVQLLTPAPLAAVDLKLPIAPEAHRLLTAGTMKMQPPFFSNLGKYWADTVVPLCQLLSVIPVSVCRRGTDKQLRISYYPEAAVSPPLVRFASPSDLVELVRNVKQMGEVLVHCCYLAFNLTHIGMIDIDPDTNRGIMVRAAIQAAIEYAARMTLLSTIRL
eukprot:6490109-Amphidinium_carterae.3